MSGKCEEDWNQKYQGETGTKNRHKKPKNRKVLHNL